MKKLVYLVGGRFRPYSYIFLRVIESRFDNGLDRMFVEFSKAPGKVAEAHYRVAPGEIMLVAGQRDADILSKKRVI